MQDMVSSCGPEFNLNAGCSLDVTGLLTSQSSNMWSEETGWSDIRCIELGRVETYEVVWD